MVFSQSIKMLSSKCSLSLNSWLEVDTLRYVSKAERGIDKFQDIKNLFADDTQIISKKPIIS